MKYNKIALIGMMGSGKTTVAQALSELTEVNWIDIDSLFETKYQLTICNFFQKYSESKFRQYETDLLKEVIQADKFILSTGGGVILSSENREVLFNKDIYTIYLEASPLNIYERIKNNNTRPLLKVDNPKKEIEKILSERIKYYKMANLTINTDNKTIDEIIKAIQWTLSK